MFIGNSALTTARDDGERGERQIAANGFSEIRLSQNPSFRPVVHMPDVSYRLKLLKLRGVEKSFLRTGIVGFMFQSLPDLQQMHPRCLRHLPQKGRQGKPTDSPNAQNPPHSMPDSAPIKKQQPKLLFFIVHYTSCAFFAISSGILMPRISASFLLITMVYSFWCWMAAVSGLILPSRISAAMWPVWTPSL